jgi:uncharacterized protein YdeI (YjbR/CyaY-like superfamily)
MKIKSKSDLEIHDMPEDFKLALSKNAKAKDTWESTTDNAKKNWICWIISPNKIETRKKRIEVGLSKLSSGMKRPCCFEGCKH